MRVREQQDVNNNSIINKQSSDMKSDCKGGAQVTKVWEPLN